MKSHDLRNDPLFLRNRQFMVGNFDMPFIYAQDIVLDGISLIGFNNIKSEEADARRSKTVHFFLDDYKFDEVWKMPERELLRLSQYAQVLSPDFSIYSDMPEPLQIYNVFRNRWCASFWQYNKVLVIPTVSWGGENTYKFCFEGIEKGCIVATSTVGSYDNQDAFLYGFTKMLETIRPKAVLNYGQTFEGMNGAVPLVVVPYQHGSFKGDS